MQVKREGSVTHIALEGALGETSDFFLLPVKDSTLINIDMAKFTFMNSIGVKSWIVWTMKLPSQCEVRLFNCPLVIASQASMIVGFMTPKMKIQSLRLPYACKDCRAEVPQFAERGKDYEYAQAGRPSRIGLVMAMPCPKCKPGKLEPDFIVGKTFRFLG